MRSAVVVGVSPETGSPAALQWAATEAALRSAPLRAVMAWRNPRAPAATGARPPIPAGASGADRAAEAEQTLRVHVRNALGSDAEVDCAVVHGSAVTALLSAADQALLLVIGEPRTGRVAGVRATLVAPQVVLRAGCPVVVMPAATPVVT